MVSRVRESRSKKKLLIPLAVGLAASIAVEAIVRAGSPAGGASAGFLFPPSKPGLKPPVPIGSASRAAGDSMVLGGQPGEKDLTLDEFLGLLSESAPPAVAERFTKEFKQQPRLQQAWNVFQKKAGGKAPAKEFLAFVGRMSEFRQLVAKFRSEPGAQQAFAAIAKNAAVGEAVRDGLRAFAGPVTGGRAGARSADAIAREWARKAVSGVDSRVKTAGGGVARGRGAAASGAAGSAGGAPGAAQLAAAGPAGAADAALKAAGAGPSAAAAGRSGAQGALKLDRSWQAKPIDDTANFADDRKWITKFLLALTESTRRAVQPLLESGAEDVWGACYITGNYDECRNVCAAVPEAQCEDKDRWEACRSAGTRNAAQCVTSCITGSAALQCVPHSDEWDPLCADKQVARNLCLTSQAYGPKTCLPGREYCSQDFGTLGGAVDPSITSGGSGPANTCGSEVEMSQPPCPQLAAMLARLQAAAAAAAAAARQQQQQNQGQDLTEGPVTCEPPYQGPCPDGGVVNPCTGACDPGRRLRLPDGNDPQGNQGNDNNNNGGGGSSFWSDVLRGAGEGAVVGGVTGALTGAVTLPVVGTVPGVIAGAAIGAIGGGIGAALKHIKLPKIELPKIKLPWG
ncbi:MAG: hypothetical protein HY553_18735 [Elusimicrobia bacterium]|nr:hypothetical protein [Elusimicrobiota bacterium]